MPPKKSSKRAPPIQDEKQRKSLKECEKIMRELMARKHSTCAKPFYRPVLETYPHLRDAYKIAVKHPMDLSTIKAKMVARKYRRVSEFVSDMRLMISNCHRFNQPGESIIAQANIFNDIFERSLAKVPADLQEDSDQQSNEDSGEDSDPESRMMHNLAEQIKRTKAQVDQALAGQDLKKEKSQETKGKRPLKRGNELVTGRSPLAKQPKTVTVSPQSVAGLESCSDNTTPVTAGPSSIQSGKKQPITSISVAEARRLAVGIPMMPMEQRYHVFQILQAEEPAFQGPRPEEVGELEIDFHQLKPVTLIALKKYVISVLGCLPPAPEEESSDSEEEGSSSSAEDEASKSSSIEELKLSELSSSEQEDLADSSSSD